MTKVYLLKTIGQGTFGIVYEAVWKGTVVAAKVIALPNAKNASTQAQQEVDMCR